MYTSLPSAERSGGPVDYFDIAERVEMGQMASMFFNKGKHSRRRASAAVPSSVPSVTFHTLMIMKFYKRSLAFAIAKTRGVIRKALHASGGN